MLLPPTNKLKPIVRREELEGMSDGLKLQV